MYLSHGFSSCHLTASPYKVIVALSAVVLTVFDRIKIVMKKIAAKRVHTSATALLLMGAVFTGILAMPSPALARPTGKPPALVITNDPLPPGLQSKIYSKPSRAPEIDPRQVMGDSYFEGETETVASRKIDELRGELFSLQGKVAELSENLARFESNGQNQAATYYASVASISTQLQSGTTPGNPRLVKKLTTARDNLEILSGNIAALNDLAMEISEAASMSSFLLESARATYGLSGAIEEDHVRLAQLEDAVNNTIVIIDRLLNNINDDITRTVAYLGTERENLRTLSLAITTGDLFGKSLSNRPFSRAQKASFSPDAQNGFPDARPSAATNSSLPGGPRPLVKIRFDRPDVAYEQPVYMAVNEALARYPNAHFELVAVHPSVGNAAEIAIESTRSRRNAERVLRSLTQMGLDMDQVDLSYSPSAEAVTNEVHLFIR